MARQTKPKEVEKADHAEIGVVGLASTAGKTTWVLVTQSVTASGNVIDYVDLMEDVLDENGNPTDEQTRMIVPSKAAGIWFIRGVNYAQSLAEEGR